MKILFFFFIFINTLIAQLTITDITSSNMIGDAYNDGKYGGHGLMFADVDGDGDPDLYITMNNSYPMSDLFFVNNGGGVLTESGNSHGISNADDGSHGWIWADLDNDGDYDGWNGSYSKNIPYRNKNNEPGYFEDLFSTSGIENINNGTRGITTLDFDNDGDLDLFANNWYARSEMELNEFYRNNGDFTFIRIDNGLSFAKGDQGVCDGDFDNDGDMDLLLSVFEGNVDGRCVEIWENINGQFVKLSNSGLNLCNASFDGTTFWDMDNDGLLDVVSREKIFKNNGNKTFTEISNIPMGSTYIYMRGIADLNNDGYWDLVVPGVSPAYINNGDMTFSSLDYNVGTINDPRCVSFADIDDDGDVDFALAQKRIYNRLYRNNYAGSNTYLKVNLRTRDNQIGAFGTKVYIYTTVGDTLLSYRQAHSNQGYLSQDDPILHFGCGNRNEVKVKAIFLNGNSYEFNANTNQKINIFDSYPDSIAPLQPTGVSAELFDQGIRLNWFKNKELDLDYYAIYKSEDPNFLIDTMSSFTFSTIDTTFLDSEIENGTFYYSITAIDTNNNESESSDNIEVIVTEIEFDVNLPTNFILKQNYPNPFNPSTTIEYNLPNDSEVKLSIYNNLGQLVAVVVNSRKVKGSHKIIFDASKLNSGVYFYTIRASNVNSKETFHDVKKLLLIK